MYIGQHAFAAGPQAGRLTAFLAQPDLTSPTASVFRRAWQSLQNRVAGSRVSGPLDASVSGHGRLQLCGRGEEERLQRKITAQIEQAARDALHTRFQQLVVEDTQREAWFAVDSWQCRQHRYSTGVFYLGRAM